MIEFNIVFIHRLHINFYSTHLRWDVFFIFIVVFRQFDTEICVPFFLFAVHFIFFFSTLSILLSQILFMHVWLCVVVFLHIDKNFKFTLYDVHLIHACCYCCCCCCCLFSVHEDCFHCWRFTFTSNVNKERRKKNYQSIFTILNWSLHLWLEHFDGITESEPLWKFPFVFISLLFFLHL